MEEEKRENSNSFIDILRRRIEEENKKREGKITEGERRTTSDETGHGKFKKWDMPLCQGKYVGKIQGRIVRDAFGRPYREIKRYADVTYPVIDSDGYPIYAGRSLKYDKTIYWIGSENYVGATPEQIKLNEDLGELIHNLNEFKLAHIRERDAGDILKRFLIIRRTDRYFLGYMKFREFRSDGEVKPLYKNENGIISLVRHRWDGLGNAFENAVYDKISNLGELGWLKECFSRKVKTSRYLFTINTVFPENSETNTYEATVRIDKVKNGIPLTEADLAEASDLTKEFITDVFDEPQVRKNIDSVRRIISDICRQTGLEWTENSEIPHCSDWELKGDVMDDE